MQRIDENTYIDDTLVTCAEYQLFIDEMREQGKYYQPDHWSSYQFSAGKAQEPIFGMRFSDAKAFCDWLTSREDSIWHYRIPFDYEVKQFPLKMLDKQPLGYWISENKEDHNRFVWIGSSPINPRAINLDFDLDINRINKIAQFATNPYVYNEHTKAAKSHSRARVLVSSLTSVRDNARGHATALDIDNAIATADKFAADRIRNAGPSYEYDKDIGPNIERNQAIAYNLAINRNLTHSRDFIFDLALELAIYGESEHDFALGLYIDLLTIRERTLGRSPAFEGIRLVKERTR